MITISINIPLEIISDEKGYIDRECPKENCLYNYKVYLQDWQNNFSAEQVFCPRCGGFDKAENWWTEKQNEQILNIINSYVQNRIQKDLNTSFKKLERSTRNSKFFKIKYKPLKPITFENNPIGQNKEWEQDIQCSNCESRFSVIGMAYFCPCCGKNLILDNAEEAIIIIQKKIDSIDEMKVLLVENYDTDIAQSMTDSMLEKSIGEVISVFQKIAETKYKTFSTKKVRTNDFQILNKGNKLFLEATGKGYLEWITQDEYNYLSLMFQKRHILEHNDGIIDKKYLEKTNDLEYGINQRLVITHKDVSIFISIIMKLTNGIKNLRV